jgi:hypothetical protein
LCGLGKHTEVAVQEIDKSLAWFKADTWKLRRMRKECEIGRRRLRRREEDFYICIKMFRDKEVEGTIIFSRNGLLLIKRWLRRE